MCNVKNYVTTIAVTIDTDCEKAIETDQAPNTLVILR